MTGMRAQGRLTAVPNDAPAEVIDIGDIDRTERLAIKPRDWPGCDHRRTVIDERLRTVSCKSCGVALDPIEVLIDIAKSWRSESFHAQRIREFEAKRFAEDTEREKRFVRQHVVCHSCGLQTRLTTGKLEPDDYAAWERHWGIEPAHAATWDPERTLPERVHRRRTEADIEANRRPIEPVPMTGSAIYVDRAPRPEHNEPRATPSTPQGEAERPAEPEDKPSEVSPSGEPE